MNENKAIYSNNNYMLDFNNPWDSFGSTPGGVIYSLGIQDQARILALGFHYLVDKLTEAEIPFVFLSFPRLVEDEGYVYDKLKDYLPKSLTREKSMKEFNKIADKNKVHFKNNELTEYNISSQKVKNNDKYLEQLLKQSNIKNMSLKEMIKNKDNMIDNLNTSLSEHSQVAKALDESNKALDESNKEVDRLKAELEIIASQMTTITNSKSWTITKPIRKVKNVFYK